MIVVLLYISADSRLWRRDAQPEQINVFCDFSRETSEMMIKCGFICEWYNVSLFLYDLSTLSSELIYHRVSEGFSYNFANRKL